jgi:hypothetical protein
MRSWKLTFAFLVAIGCNRETSEQIVLTPPADEGGSPDTGPLVGPAPQPMKLADDAVVIVGVTSDNHVIYRNSRGLAAIRIDGTEGEPRLVSDRGGTVQIRGTTVFLFSDVDWTTNLGELTIWTSEHGSREVGTVMYGEDTALANHDGTWLAWLANVTETTADLIVSTPDLAVQHSVITGLGRGNAETCRATYSFVGDRLFAAWCAPGSRGATLQRFTAPDFAPEILASEVNTLWSADQSGERVFYTDPSSRAWFHDGQQATRIDAGVAWGTMLHDGSGVLYTVSDQLRRTSVPEIAPVPVVATQFVARASWSPDFRHALYSTVVTYEGGTRRDLRLTDTEAFNPSPHQLVAEPRAEMTRSSFTRDGNWVLFLTSEDHGKTLHVRAVDGNSPLEAPGADTAIAGHGSRIVYSDNRSDPSTYPITADLKVIDPRYGGEPLLLQARTTDGRAFHVSADGTRLVYVMPPAPGTPAGVYAQDIP